MKRFYLLLVLLLPLAGCLTAAPQSQLTPVELERINNISFIDSFDALPPDKHIKIIGQAAGKYETTYGKPLKMINEMKMGAFRIQGDALLPYSTSQQYISMARTTIIHGTADVVVYIEPVKDIILNDYSKGHLGGYVSLSASRFAGQYQESAEISKHVIQRAYGVQGADPFVSFAMNVMAQAQGAEAKDYLLSIVSQQKNTYAESAIAAISPYLSIEDKEQLIRYMRFHENTKVKYTAAKALRDLGARKEVEEYVQQSNNRELASLLL